MSSPFSILLVQGDAEAYWLRDAAAAFETILPGREVRLVSTWATRPDWLDPAAEGPPEILRTRGLIPDADVRELLHRSYQLVIFALLPLVAVPSLRHHAGGRFLAHRGVRERWSSEEAASVAAQCTEQAGLSPEEACAALQPHINHLLEAGTAVAVANAFRHVRAPLEHRRAGESPSLRDLVRGINLEAARLSQRTGCFVLDVDRPLAQEGGAALGADCFGGGDRASELILDELLALAMDALPDQMMQLEA
jgi:hypothetical protein